MKRTGVLAVALVALAALVFWIADADDLPLDDRSPDAVARGGVRPAAAPVAVPQAEELRTAVEPRADGRATSPARDPLRVRVIEAVTEQPVPFAVVRTLALVDAAVFDGAELQEAWQQDLEDCAVRFGVAVSCDERGVAILPRSRDARRGWRQVYSAREGARFGSSKLTELRAEELVIRIDGDRHVDVEVVDALGRPAAEVAVVHRVVDSTPAMPTGRMWTIRTDGRGRARLAHVQTRVIAREQTSTVGVEVPGLPVATMPLDCAFPPALPLRFELPPSGAVEVVDDGPAAFTEGQSFTLSDTGGEGRGAIARCRAGRARFPYVGLGREYVFEAISRAGSRSFELTGPVRMDETVVFTVPERTSPLLGLRLVDARGAPVAVAGVAIELGFADTVASMARSADSEGRCWFPLGADDRGRTLERVAVCVESGTYAGDRGELACKQVVEDVVELGVIQLQAAPLWGAGRAIDEAGAPVRGLSLQVTGPGDRSDADLPRIRALDEGRFELRGGENVDRIVLRGGRSDDGAEQVEPVPATRGDENLVVRLVRGASLAVEFVHEPGCTYRLGITLHPDDGRPRIDGSMSAQAAGRGTRYRFDRVLVGSYAFRATLLGETEPIFSVGDVVLRAGENRDPRLEGITLNGVRALRVAIRGTQGGAVPVFLRGMIWIRGDSVWRGRRFIGTRIDLAVRRGPVDVLVAADGFAPARRLGVTGDLALELARLPAVPVELVVDGGAPGADALVYVQLVPPRESSERFESAEPDVRVAQGSEPWRWPVPVHTGSRREVLHDGPGEYRLRVFLSAGNEHDDELSDFTPKSVTIPASGVAALLTLRVPASAFQR